MLIADKLNNRLVVVDPHGRVRWSFPRHGDLRHGQKFRIPDDAFFTPNGRFIVATQEDADVVSVIDVAKRRIVYRYGKAGHPGKRGNRVSHPDDAMMLPNGDIIVADIKNCRVLLLHPPFHHPARHYGRPAPYCPHRPPRRFGSPNGAFPMRDGRYLVTEIHGDWVDAMSLSGKVFWSVHPPGVRYPSDTNEIRPGRYLTADYSKPGQIVVFDRHGRTRWRYRPGGREALDHPSLAIPLPNGDILCNDDHNDRVIVIDPKTDKVVWQYGHTGVSGRKPGYLNNPDGVDLVPPHSFALTHG